MGFLELPENFNCLKGIVVITHGLGGSTKRFGLKRISRKLVNNGFGVLKLNLRGQVQLDIWRKGIIPQDVRMILFWRLKILDNFLILNLKIL